MATGESKARLRDEVAALSETVRDLRDEVARLRVGQHGCGCVHVCTHPAYQPFWWQPTQVWCGGVAGGNTGVYTVANSTSTLTADLNPGQIAATGCAAPGATSTYTVSL